MVVGVETLWTLLHLIMKDSTAIKRWGRGYDYQTNQLHYYNQSIGKKKSRIGKLVNPIKSSLRNHTTYLSETKNIYI